MKKKKISPMRILLIVLVTYMAFQTIYTTVYYFDIKNEYANAEQKLAFLREENEKIKQEIALADQQEYIEKIARENLMLAKEGETVVYFKWISQEETKEESSPNSEKNFFKTLFDNFLELFKK